MIICLMGPTATGKTDIAIHLARKFPCEIISVDSAMVYRGMDIGTAKPSSTICAEIPHHLINQCDPTENYSAGKFYQEASLLIKDILKRNKIPLFVGGTMLYFRTLQQGMTPLPPANPLIREKINLMAQQIGWPAIHQKLAQVDALTAARLSTQDSQRIQRALEVYILTKKPLSEWHRQIIKLPYTFTNIALLPQDREKLKQKISQRFYSMLAQGFLDEVAHLYQRKDLHFDLPALRAVGYRQAWQYCAGQYDYATMIYEAITATQQLAKRQLTWLRQWPNCHYFYYDLGDITTTLYHFLQQKIEQSQTR